MPLGTDHIIVSEVPNFIPELWADEVIAAYKQNLVMANLVRKLNHRGKKGDTIRIPTPARALSSVKAAETEVTLIEHGTDAGVVILIDQHREYSRLIEDIVDVQALESLRRFYTDDGGYAIAKAVDTDLITESLRVTGATIPYTEATNTIPFAGRTLAANQVREGDGSVWDETASTDISDAGIRQFVKDLDDADTPMADRYLVIPTIVKQDMLGLARFTEEAFTGERAQGNSIRNGLVGNVYAVDVFVTTQLPLVEDNGATADNVLGLMFHTDGLVLVEQMGVRAQTQYKQEWLADLFTVDMIYGDKVLRDDSIVPFVVPTT